MASPWAAFWGGMQPLGGNIAQIFQQRRRQQQEQSRELQRNQRDVLKSQYDTAVRNNNFEAVEKLREPLINILGHDSDVLTTTINQLQHKYLVEGISPDQFLAHYGMGKSEKGAPRVVPPSAIQRAWPFISEKMKEEVVVSNAEREEADFRRTKNIQKEEQLRLDILRQQQNLNQTAREAQEANWVFNFPGGYAVDERSLGPGKKPIIVPLEMGDKDGERDPKLVTLALYNMLSNIKTPKLATDFFYSLTKKTQQDMMVTYGASLEKLVQTKLTPAQERFYREIRDPSDALRDMKAYLKDPVYDKYFNPVMWNLYRLNWFDSDAQVLDAAVIYAAQVVGTYLEKGVLKEPEYQRYLKMVPRAGDTKEAAWAKLDRLERVLKKSVERFEAQMGISPDYSQLTKEELRKLLKGRDPGAWEWARKNIPGFASNSESSEAGPEGVDASELTSEKKKELTEVVSPNVGPEAFTGSQNVQPSEEVVSSDSRIQATDQPPEGTTEGPLDRDNWHVVLDDLSVDQAAQEYARIVKKIISSGQTDYTEMNKMDGLGSLHDSLDVALKQGLITREELEKAKKINDAYTHSDIRIQFNTEFGNKRSGVSRSKQNYFTKK